MGYFLTLNNSTDTNSGVQQNARRLRQLFHHSSLSYIVLASSSAVINSSDKTLIFLDFQGPTIKFHDFPGLENEILKFLDFPGFPWSVRTLFIKTTVTKNKKKRKGNQPAPVITGVDMEVINWTNLRCKRQNGVSHIVKHTRAQYSYVIVRPKKKIRHKCKLFFFYKGTVQDATKVELQKKLYETNTNSVVILRTKVSMVLCP